MKKKRGKGIRYFVEVENHFWVRKLNKWVLRTEKPIRFEDGFSSCRVFRTINATLKHLDYLYNQGYKYKIERFSTYKGRRRVQGWTNS